jgi:phage terminase large subunit-like protein
MTFIEHSQKSSTRAVSDVRFMEALRRKEFVHDGDPIFRQHVLNAVEHQLSGGMGGFYFDRPSGARKPIDALVAASIAHSVAIAEFEKQPSTLYGWS